MIAEYFRILGTTLLYLLSILGWGRLPMRLVRQCEQYWEGLAVQLVFGCCALYVLFLTLGFSGTLHPFAAVIVIITGAILSLAGLPKLIQRARSALAVQADWDKVDRTILKLIGLFAVLQIIFALTPLMFYDLQAYLYLAPAEFLMSGGFKHILWNVQTNTPLAMPLIVGMSVALDKSGQTAKLIFAVLGCLTAAGAYQFIRPSGRRAALLASLCVLAFPEFLLMQTFGAIDLAVAGLMVFGAVWARRALLERSTPFAVFAGLAFGLAIGSRYQALVLVCWLVGIFLAEAAIHKEGFYPASVVRRVAVMAGLTCLLVAPWLLRNYAHLGNPVFPLLQSLWPDSGEWSPAQTEIWNTGVFGPPASQLSAVQRVLAPIGILLLQPSNGLFGTALLLGALLAIFLSNPEIRLAGIIGLSGLLIWGVLRPGAGAALLRYNAFSLIFLLAATGAVLGSDWIKSRGGVTIAIAISAVSMLIGIVHVQSILPALQSLVSVNVRDEVHRNNVPSWAAFNYVNDKLDRQHDRILLLGETRAFWLQVPYIAPSVYNGPQLDALFGGDSNPDAWAHNFKALGLTHLLISNSEIERWHRQYNYLNLSRSQADKFNRWLQTLPKRFDDGRGNVVLALEPISK